MENKIFQVPAILDRANPTKDGGMSLNFKTNEVSHEEKVLLMEKLGSFGHLLFKENDFVADDIPTQNAEDGSKTPSQRLRDVLFVLFKQKGGGLDYEAFYRKQMEVIIDNFKNKLEPKK